MSLEYSNFMVGLGGEIDRLTNHFVFDGYQTLSEFLQAPLGSMIVIYIILVGYGMVRGVIDKPQQELFKFAIRAGLIYMFAMNWDFFASYARDLLVTGSETIASTLMKAVNENNHATSINQGLQDVLNDILELGCNLFKEGSIRKLTPYFAGMLVFLSGSITVGLAFIEIIIAKLMLAITLCTAPLFIIFTLFDQTKSFFERWLGVLVGFAFVLVFVSSVMGLCLHLLHWITASALSTSTELTAAMWVPIFIVCCLCVMAIIQASGIGKSIGGTVSTSSGAAMVGGFVGGALGAWAMSKSAGQKSANLMRSAGGKFSHSGKALFQQMQKNIRRGQ